MSCYIRIAGSGLALVLALSACGGSSTETATTATTPAAPPAAAGRAATAASPTSAGTKEVELVRAVRPRVTALVDALKRGDIAGARAAYQAYDAGWNGIEVYLNVRSRPLYGQLENDLQATIEKGLEEPRPNMAELVVAAEALGGKYDEAIALSAKGPALSPLFDDVAAIRIVRADLRMVTPALKAGDTARAKSTFGAFQQGWPEVEQLIKVRSADAHREIGEAMNQVDQAFQQASPAGAQMILLVDALLDRYNFGLRLVNAAARNADLTRTTYTPEEVKAAAALGGIATGLRTSLAAWEGGDYPAAAAGAQQATGPLFEGVSASLAAKNADADLKKALESYAALAGTPGDAANVHAAQKAAVEAVAVAQQVLVGQFWTDPKLQAELAAARKA